MTSQYADYDFYVNVYLGNKITPDDFPRLSARASEYIRGLTRRRVECVPQCQREPIQLAVCAVAEIMQDEGLMVSRSFSGEQVVSSESVGSYSVSYSSPSISSSESDYIAQQKRETALQYLCTVPALADMFGVRSHRCRHQK